MLRLLAELMFWLTPNRGFARVTNLTLGDCRTPLICELLILSLLFSLQQILHDPRFSKCDVTVFDSLFNPSMKTLKQMIVT